MEARGTYEDIRPVYSERGSKLRIEEILGGGLAAPNELPALRVKCVDLAWAVSARRTDEHDARRKRHDFPETLRARLGG